ncbi:MAG: aminoacyl-tRNA hydrolase [Chitinophagaceae bacterium]|nr:aminoacyl-tRNA hydrolase [Chitinophagaceae bacterium]
MPVNISPEITFKTARSSGKGGQHVNKTETMVEGNFDVSNSLILTEEQKKTILSRLKNRINSAGILQVRSQTHRSQLSNKADVVQKMNSLLQLALKKEKKRIDTKPTKASKLKRLESKKRTAEQKQNRQKFRYNES